MKIRNDIGQSCMNSFGVFQELIKGDTSSTTKFYLDQKSRSLLKTTYECFQHGITLLTKILKVGLNVFKSVEMYYTKLNR